MLLSLIIYILIISSDIDCIFIHILIEKLFLLMELLAKNEKSIVYNCIFALKRYRIHKII